MAKIYSVVAFDPPMNENAPFGRGTWCEAFAPTLLHAESEASRWREDLRSKVFVREVNTETMMSEIIAALNGEGPDGGAFLPPPITERGAIIEQLSDERPPGL